MKDLARKITGYNMVIQPIMWSSQCIIAAFANALLLQRGLSTTQIGLFATMQTALIVLLQPAVSSLVDRNPRITSRRVILVLCVIEAVLAAGMLLGIDNLAILTVGLELDAICRALATPFFSTMVMDFSLRGVPVNFTLGRGLGSAVYATTSVLLGIVVSRKPTEIVVPIYLCSLVIVFLSVLFFRYQLPPLTVSPSERPPVIGVKALLKKYPAFAVLLLGCALMMGSHNGICSYNILMVQRAGGDVGMLGTYGGICAYTELPCMLFFFKLRQKFSLKKLFRFCSVMFIVRNIVFLLAKNLVVLYIGAVMQSVQYAILLPCTIYYVAENLDLSNQAKGQSLINLAIGAMASVCFLAPSGWLIDTFSLDVDILVMTCVSVIGCIVVWIATGMKNTPKETNCK